MGAEVVNADFQQYLSSADAQRAPVWQLTALATLTRGLPPLTPDQFAELRAALTRYGGDSGVFTQPELADAISD